MRTVHALLLSIYGASLLISQVCLADTATHRSVLSNENKRPAGSITRASSERAQHPAVIRVAIAAPLTSKLSAPLIEWLEHLVAKRYDLVNHFEYQAFAERLHVKSPLSSRAAWRIAHVAHASHILVIKPISPDGATVKIFLIDTESGELLFFSRHQAAFALWSEVEQRAFEEKFFAHVRSAPALVPSGEPRPAAPASLPRSVAPAGMKDAQVLPAVRAVKKTQTSGTRLSPASLTSRGVHPQSGPDPRLREDDGVLKPDTKGHAREDNVGPTLQLALGLSVARRRATLHPRLLEAGTPPCFCKERGYSGAFPSLVASGSLRRPSRQGGVGLAVRTELGFSAQPSAAIHTGDSAGGVAFRIETLLFSQVSPHPVFLIRPEVGYFYRLFDVKDGPFLALARGGPQASLLAHVESPNRRIQTDARVGLQVFLQEGAEAIRLGSRKGGMGYFVEVAPKIQFAIFYAEVGIRFEQAGLSYGGATALFDGAALRDVHLTDTLFGGFATAGLAL